MKLSSIVVTSFLALSALATGSLADKPTNLRRSFLGDDEADHLAKAGRRSLFGTITFAQIAAAFQPILAIAMEASLSAGADPLALGATFTQELDSVVLNADCTSSAKMTVTVRELDGLGGFVLNNLPVVGGSQETSFSFFDGITWAASFLAEGSFPEGLELPVDATITADACGAPFQQSVSGVVDAVNAGARFTVDASGSTPGLFTLASSTAGASLSGDASFDIGQLSTDLDFGNGVEVDIAQILQDVLSTPAFLEQVATLIANYLNNALSGLTLTF